MKFEASTQEWKTFTVDEIKADTPNALATGPFGSSIGPRFFESYGVPLIRGTNLSEDISVRLNHENIAFMSLEKSKDFERSKARKGDLIFTSRGSVGQVGLIDKNCPHPEYVISNNMMKLSPNPKKVDSNFLYYLFSSPLMVDEIKNQTIGTSVPGFNLGQLRSLTIRLPPLPEQRAIARILGSLDDKIEANRRMNQTLEALARTLFKSWFVDFDPVRAKAEGREPAGMDAQTAELFPDGFEDSDIGEIPKGWNVRSIGDVVNVLGGGTPSTIETSYWEGGIHSFCTPKDMSSLTSPILLNTERHLTDTGLVKVSSGQLPIGTVLMSSRAPIGYLAISEIPVSINQGIIAMVCDRDLQNLYVLNWAQTNMEGFIAVANGSTFLEISKWNFRPIKVLVPPTSILKEFMRAINPVYLQITNNAKQSLTLEELRNAILPRLISGEIPVNGRDVVP